MAETDPGSRSCTLCFTKTSLVCVLVSVPFLVLSCFLGVWFLPCLVTFSVLVLSNVLFCIFTKKKVVLDCNLDPLLVLDGDELMCSSKNLVEVEVNVPGSQELLSETETVALEQNATHQVEGNQIHNEHAFKMPEIEMGSDSEREEEEESQNHGLNWFCTDDVDEESTETSNDSVSASSDEEDEDDEDDDSLIEIALPGEEAKQKMQSNLPTDLLSETNFGQQGLVELLEEINEMNELEDNLIEIDISKFDLYELDIKC